MGRLTAMLVLAGILSQGCASTRPPDNVGFAKVTTLAQYDGIYKNAGEGKEAWPTYLSALIWPQDGQISHSMITTIEVRASGQDTLTVRARRDLDVVKERTFIKGKDFSVHDGRLRIKYHASVHANNNFEDPMLGFEWKSIELGLDQKGAGKSKETDDFIGLAFLVMPMAGRDTRELRFVKLGD